MNMRLAVGLLVSGTVVTVGALLAGNHSLTPSWEALRSVVGILSLVWLWANPPLPREMEEEITCE